MPQQPLVTAIGAISGTSMDGIDVALVRTDGNDAVETGPGRTYPYDAALRGRLHDVLADPSCAERDPLTALEAEVTRAHAAAIQQFMQDFAIAHEDVALVGMHGQTVYHRPQNRFTRQLCSGPQAAALLHLDVVSRFRHADLAAGGQGAPFAPLYHRALARSLERPLMVLNLGGVGNVTYIDGDEVIAFDTGPASALIDDFVRRRRGLAFDENGRLAGSGRVDAKILAQLMDNPFFDQPPPKSLDRNEFHRRAEIIETLTDADGAATLAAFTIEATAASLRHVPARPRRWLVGGGGRHNAMFMRGLGDRLRVPVEPVEAVGWDGDFLEAQCFGYLAVRSIRGLPLSLPTTTGVPFPMPGGELSRA